MDTNLNELEFGWFFVLVYGTVLNLCRALVTGRHLRTGQPLYGHWSCSRIQNSEMLSSSRRAIFCCWGLTRHNWRQPVCWVPAFIPYVPSKLGLLAAERGVRLIGALTIKALQALHGSREKVESNQSPVVVRRRRARRPRQLPG